MFIERVSRTLSLCVCVFGKKETVKCYSAASSSSGETFFLIETVRKRPFIVRKEFKKFTTTFSETNTEYNTQNIFAKNEITSQNLAQTRVYNKKYLQALRHLVLLPMITFSADTTTPSLVTQRKRTVKKFTTNTEIHWNFHCFARGVLIIRGRVEFPTFLLISTASSIMLNL